MECWAGSIGFAARRQSGRLGPYSGAMAEPGVPAATEPIGLDVPCIKCGYNLRGLMQGAVCPECGTAIADSFRPDYLRFADSAWLESLRRGAVCAIIGLLLMPVVVMLMGFLFVSSGGSEGALLLIPITLAAASSLATSGWWMLSKRDPTRARGSDALGSYVRLSSGLFMAGTAALLAVACMEITRTWPRADEDLGLLLAGALWLGWFVWCVAGAMLLNALFVRIPDELGASASMSVLLAAFLLNSVGVLLVVGPLVALVLEVLLLVRLGRALAAIQRSRRDAEAHPPR